MPKKYSQKSKATKYQYYNYLDKIIVSGKSISQIKRLNVKQWQKLFGKQGRLKKTSLEAKKRIIIQQISKDINQVVSDYIERKNIKNKDYKVFLYNESYKLFRIKKEEIKEINELKYEDITGNAQYGVVKVIDLKDNQEYYLKYKNKRGLKKQFKKLEQKYNIKNYVSKLLGIYTYKSHTTNEFKKRLENYDLII